jgi:cell division septation protein DedD
MSPKKSRSGKSTKGDGKKKRSVYQLTRKEMFLWLGVAFLVVAWMFILGVIVGRGLSPVRFDVEKLTNELIALKQSALKSAEEAKKPSVDVAPEKRDLGFYDVLTDKKEEARLKSLANAQKLSVSPRSSETKRTPGGPEPWIQRKTSVAKKEKQVSGAAVAEPGPAQKSFTLQVASLKDFSKAEKIVSLLQKKGYKAYTVTAHVNGKGTYHRIRVGHFKDRGDARPTALRLRAEKYEPIVIQE